MPLGIVRRPPLVPKRLVRGRLGPFNLRRVFEASNGAQDTHASSLLVQRRNSPAFCAVRAQSCASNSEWTAVRNDAQWKEAAVLVEQFGFEAEDVDGYLAQAFGWGTQKYWKSEKVQEMPNPIQIRENVAYLREVGFGDEDLKTLIQKFPEFLGCDLSTCLRPNVDCLQKNFFLQGPHRIRAILRKPEAIGNVIDCEGNCQGQCTRCPNTTQRTNKRTNRVAQQRPSPH